MIKHVSLDVWNTLVIGNEKFSDKRLQTIMDFFKLPPSKRAETRETYNSIKKSLDMLAEKTGAAFSTMHNYGMLAANLGFVNYDIEELHKLQRLIEADFNANLPIIRDDTIKSIHQLVNNGVTVSIGSNTNFISGNVMWPYLTSMMPFSFGVFSDLELVSKPNPKFFTKIITLTQSIYPDPMLIASQDIIHIGDNVVCDANGARDSNMKFKLIHSVSELPTVLSNVLTHQPKGKQDAIL